MNNIDWGFWLFMIIYYLISVILSLAAIKIFGPLVEQLLG